MTSACGWIVTTVALVSLTGAGCVEPKSPFVGTWSEGDARVVLEKNGLGSARLFGAIADRPLSWTMGVDGAVLRVGGEVASAREFTATITGDGRLRVVASSDEQVLMRRETPDAAPGG